LKWPIVAFSSCRTKEIRDYARNDKRNQLALVGMMSGFQQEIHSDLDQSRFFENGFYEPIPLLNRAQCQLARRHLNLGDLPEPAEWEKGRAVTDHLLFHLATLPSLLSILRPLLGEDVVLWGADVLVREPGQIHPWHCDIESSAHDDSFVSVWIGIENTSRASALQLISRSHLFHTTIQEVAHAHGVRRGQASQELVLKWARNYDRGSEFVQPEMHDGDALIFDGHLWHGSHNTRNSGARTALLFQYTAPSTKVLMPDFAQLEWPFRYKTASVPVLLVSGCDHSAVNHVVAPPARQDRQLAGLQIFPVRLPLTGDSTTGWKPHHLFAGATPNLERISSHVSVLNPACCPHAPHAHREEEILIVLDGEAELVVGESFETARTERCAAGSFVYYPAYQHHTIRNSTARPITYLMFKWTGVIAATESPLPTQIIEPKTLPTSDGAYMAQPLLEGGTSYLRKLHAHLTTLQGGGGYEPHIDRHDVAIVVLEGKIEIMGASLAPHDVAYCPAGLPHDIKNSKETVAHYLVFEFHATRE
jgi:mannose-6-phosphate isomerase-like protein (cupin superfamily)